MTPRMKVCTGCERLLSFDQFYRHPSGKYGLRSKCKDCVGADNARWKAANAAQNDRYNRERRETAEYLEYNRRHARARQRAYRELARRHPDEFDHLVRVEKALLGLRPRP